MKEVITKTCKSCGIEKLCADFSKQRCICKLCIKTYASQYREKNREKLNARRREYDNKNREKINARQREYRNKNREKINARQREYRNKNREKLNALRRECDNKNREKINARQREYRNKNREKINARQSERVNTLNDPYIIQLLKKEYKLHINTIYSYHELIETYRQQIKIKRLLKQKKNGNAEKNTEASQPEIDLSLLR